MRYSYPKTKNYTEFVFESVVEEMSQKIHVRGNYVHYNMDGELVNDAIKKKDIKNLAKEYKEEIDCNRTIKNDVTGLEKLKKRQKISSKGYCEYGVIEDVIEAIPSPDPTPEETMMAREDDMAVKKDDKNKCRRQCKNAVDMKELIAPVRAIMRKQTELDRNIYYLIYKRELSYREVAKKLSLDKTTVIRHDERIRTIVEEELERQYPAYVKELRLRNA